MTINIDKYKDAVKLQEPFVVTGVMGGNDVEWEWVGNEYTCIDCEAASLEWLAEHPDATPDEQDEYFYYNTLCEGHDHLYGDWKQGDDGLWDVDKNGSDGYAFIYNSNENTVQVAWSKLVKWTWPCSPCYPGQGDVTEESPLVSEPQPKVLRREVGFLDTGETGNEVYSYAWAAYSLPIAEEEWELLDALNKEVTL